MQIGKLMKQAVKTEGLYQSVLHSARRDSAEETMQSAVLKDKEVWKGKLSV